MRLQKGLLAALSRTLGCGPTKLLRKAYEAGSSGVVVFDDEQWLWRIHGTGISFEGERGRVVDAHTNVFDPTQIDPWRIAIFTGFGLTEADAAMALAAFAADGELGLASLPGTAPRGCRYRLPADQFELEWPWVAVGAKGGGWIEFQPGPFEHSHWHDDSLFVDAFDSSVLYPALHLAIPRFDIFSFYESVDPQVVGTLVKALRAHAVAALESPSEDWWQSVECAAVGGRRDAGLALRIYDLSWGLANWLENTVREHGTLSILGA